MPSRHATNSSFVHGANGATKTALLDWLETTRRVVFRITHARWWDNTQFAATKSDKCPASNRLCHASRQEKGDQMGRIETHRINKNRVPLKIEVLSFVISWKHGFMDCVTVSPHCLWRPCVMSLWWQTTTSCFHLKNLVAIGPLLAAQRRTQHCIVCHGWFCLS